MIASLEDELDHVRKDMASAGQPQQYFVKALQSVTYLHLMPAHVTAGRCDQESEDGLGD